MKVSVITVTFNSAAALERHWMHFDPTWAEWIVVDNNSSDDSTNVANRLGATVVRLDSNEGFSAANNRGTAEATGDVLVFCNPDVEVEQVGLLKLAEQARAQRQLVAPQLLNSDGSPQENGRGAPYPHRKFIHMFGRAERSHETYGRIAGPTETRDVVWVMGAAVAMTRTVFETIGGWNSRFFIYYEDAEICLRAFRHGIPTRVMGEVRWKHGWDRATSRGFRWSVWRHEFRSAAIFYMQNLYCVLPVGRRGRALRMRDQGLK